jgi:hypothetical protein
VQICVVSNAATYDASMLEKLAADVTQTGDSGLSDQSTWTWTEGDVEHNVTV